METPTDGPLIKFNIVCNEENIKTSKQTSTQDWTWVINHLNVNLDFHLFIMKKKNENKKRREISYENL